MHKKLIVEEDINLASLILHKYYTVNNSEDIEEMYKVVTQAILKKKVKNEVDFIFNFKDKTWSEFKDVVYDQLRLF